MTNNKQCPNCKTYKTQSQRQMYIIIGIMCLSFGVLLIWLPFIGLPLIVFGVVGLITGLVAPKNMHHCNNCKNNFKV